jgi:PAS domain S-box-containing protein
VESLDRVISWQGKPAVQVVVRDMTRHEESLRQGQARIDAMLRASPDSLICLGGDGEILDIRMTQSFVNYFGERRRVGRNISELMPEAEAENVKRIFRRVLETGKMERAEHVANVDGEERRFEGRVTPSGPSEVLLVMRDITEERRASNALRDQELRFRKVFEEGPLGMALVGTDLKFFQANARLCEMLGYSEDELAELSFLDVTHPDDVDRDLRVLKQLPNADTKSFTLEKRFVRKDGRSVPIRATGTFITQAGTGRIVYGIGMYEDITEERRSESALRDAQVRLHHSERLASLGTFAAGIAHEINNPIGSILIAAQYALGADDVPDDARKGLEDIAVHARRCGKIVKNVLRFARQETLERSDCDLNQCIDRVGDLAGYVADRHRARVIFRPSAGCLPVRISSTAIEQVLLNLVRNAVEAGRPGDEVIVATSVHGEHALLAVSDRGRGMTVEQKTYLFDPFYTTRRADGGTGLGLSISHGIITDHGGTIRVESQPGSGTTVTVALPLLQDSDIQE